MRISKLQARTEPVVKITLTIAEAQVLWHIANAAEGTPLTNYREESIPNQEHIMLVKRQIYAQLCPIIGVVR